MRTVISVLLLLSACGDPEPARVDAAIKVIDASVDAAVDAAPDAPPDAAPDPAITMACMHACDALAACFMEPPDTDCYMECAEDLADCTPQQVADIDACSTQPCGDDVEEGPLVACIMAVPCVEM